MTRENKTCMHLSTRLKRLETYYCILFSLHVYGPRSFFWRRQNYMAYGKTDTELLIKESLIIKQLNPQLNATVKSFPLEMFQLSRDFFITVKKFFFVLLRTLYYLIQWYNDAWRIETSDQKYLVLFLFSFWKFFFCFPYLLSLICYFLI